MPKDPRPMVLRSINLPTELDDQLRAVAFVLRRPKSDLIRMFVADGLIGLMAHLKSASETKTPELLNSLYAHIEKSGRPYSTEEGRRFQDDFDKMRRILQHQGQEAYADAAGE
jgi:hypothetical protein